MKIAVLGCGKMGGGIAERLAKEHELFLFDHNPEKTNALSKKMGGKSCKNAKEAVSKGEVIILAVKPKDFNELAKEIHREIYAEQLVISCLTGITTEALQEYFVEIPVLRIMPNLAVIFGEGVIGAADTGNLTKSYKEKANKLFSPLGEVHWIPETQIDAISSLTGSGPAFVSVFIEAMVDAGIAMGIDSEKAKQLVFQLMTGTVKVLKETGKHPGSLKWEVSSPGGTTIEGLRVLEDYGVRAGIINTFLATYRRNIEMTQDHNAN